MNSRRPGKKRKVHTPQEALVKAMNHPVRVKALTILTERTASPNEISREIQAPLSNVSYHVRVLDELGLVELTDEAPVRGSVEHFYRAVERPLLDHSEWEKIDPKLRSVASAHVIEAVLQDASGSLAASLFDQRPDRHVSRTALVLDEEGWQRVTAIQNRALQEIHKEHAAAEVRLSHAEGRSLSAIAAMFCFEVPRSP